MYIKDAQNVPFTEWRVDGRGANINFWNLSKLNHRNPQGPHNLFEKNTLVGRRYALFHKNPRNPYLLRLLVGNQGMTKSG